MFSFVRTVFLAIGFGALFTFSAISAEDTAQQQVPEFKVPDDVQSDGAFRYSMPFNLPEFRGLVPKVGLTYNSSFKGHGSAEVWLGAGWRLSGFSSIERVTIGNGTPTYNDTRDLYRLDGIELLACNDAAATNPWPATRSYPDRYKTDTPSASCSAGGNLAPIVENYRKIEMKQQSYGGGQVDYFVVTARDGTQYRYDSVGVLAAETLVPSTWKRYGVLFQRKFLLSEIRDTQATPNIVTITYDFSSKTKGLAHRPRHIAYGGYNVWFSYSYLDKPLATYATGTTGFSGEQNWRLESVVVRDGAMPVRAYGFDYTQSAQSETVLLNSVRAYGKVFSKSGAIITGGDELPSPLKNLTYSADQTSFTEVEYPNENFHRGLRVFDYDRDGQEELIFPKVHSSDVTGDFGDSGPTVIWIPEYNLQSSYTDIGFNRQTNTAIPHPVLETMQVGEPLESYESWVRENIVGFTGYQPNADNSFFISKVETNTISPHDGATKTASFKSYGITPATGPLMTMAIPPEYTARIANLDDDPEMELLVGILGTSNPISSPTVGGQFWYYELVNGIPSYNSAINDLKIGDFADIDGDGVSEMLAPHGAYSTPQYMSPCGKYARNWVLTDSYNGDMHVSEIGNPDSCLVPSETTANKISTAYGDVNGDGAEDLVIFNIRFTESEQIYVSLSSGSGFEDHELWGSDTTLPVLGTED